MKQVPPPFPGATKTLILAHRQELLNQTQNHVLRSGAGLVSGKLEECVPCSGKTISLDD